MTKSKAANPLSFKYKKDAATAEEPFIHVYRKDVVCETDARGHATPGARSPAEIVLDSSEGFIPLWAPNTTLRWRFQPRSLSQFRDPEAAKEYLRDIFAHGILLWEGAAPVNFKEAEDAWDFELVVRQDEKCTPNGCTLASAFFPDAGRHELRLYPTMFDQSRAEQIETMAHEVGHIFGLRHFFANIRETAWSSEIFGKHKPFSIMNYGALGKMSSADINDLKRLYELVWTKQLTSINGTAIKLVKPFSSFANRFQNEAIAALVTR